MARHDDRRDRVLTCQGRAVDDDLQPVGEPCGRTLVVRGRGNCWALGDDMAEMSWQPPVPPSDGEVRDRAIAAGWSVGGPPMCPRCRRPDPAIVRGLA